MQKHYPKIPEGFLHPSIGSRFLPEHSGKGRVRDRDPLGRLSPEPTQRLESHSASSSYHILLIHAADLRLPDVHTPCASFLIKLAQPPLGGRIRCGWMELDPSSGCWMSAFCLSQSRIKVSSAFCSQVCLLAGGRHSIVCTGSSQFVGLSEGRLKISPKKILYWRIREALLSWILLPKAWWDQGSPRKHSRSEDPMGLSGTR